MKYAALAFPAGAAGAGLAVLRISVAFAWISAGLALSPARFWSAWALYGLAALVAAGMYARMAAIAGIVGFGLLATSAGPMAVHALDAVALALLGPGALSVDGLRFGRRTLRLPGTPPTV